MEESGLDQLFCFFNFHFDQIKSNWNILLFSIEKKANSPHSCILKVVGRLEDSFYRRRLASYLLKQCSSNLLQRSITSQQRTLEIKLLMEGIKLGNYCYSLIKFYYHFDTYCICLLPLLYLYLRASICLQMEGR